ASSINSATQMICAIGWLSATTLVGYSVQNHPPRPPYSPLGAIMATGRRSMTSYLLQTVLFIPVVITLRATGLHEDISLLILAGIAVVVWSVISLICALMESMRYQGPSEHLLRKMVHQSGSESDRGRLSIGHHHQAIRGDI